MTARPAAASSSSSLSSDAAPQKQLNPRFSPQRSPSPPVQHRRGYQACDPCRKRKVKCDLGSTYIYFFHFERKIVNVIFLYSILLPTAVYRLLILYSFAGVDNPRPPPCVRCRRESKRCEFSATRRKRKASEIEEVNPRNEVLRRDMRMMSADTTHIESTVNNNDNRNQDDSVPPPSQPTYTTTPVDHDSVTPSQRKWSEPSIPSARLPIPHSSQSRVSQPSISSTIYQRHHSFAENTRNTTSSHTLSGGEQMMNTTAVDLLSPAISNTHDALHLLSEAAGRTEDFNRQQMEYRYTAPQSSSSAYTSTSPMAQMSTPGKTSGTTPNSQPAGSLGWYHDRRSANADQPAGQRGPILSKAPESADYANARRAWSRLRFIRAGWFTVDEAMNYIA